MLFPPGRLLSLLLPLLYCTGKGSWAAGQSGPEVMVYNCVSAAGCTSTAAAASVQGGDSEASTLGASTTNHTLPNSILKKNWRVPMSRKLLGDQGIIDHGDYMVAGTGMVDAKCGASFSLGGYHTCVIEVLP